MVSFIKMSEPFDKRIVVGMVVSTQYIRSLANIFKPSLINNRYSAMIATWCLEYFQTYQKAPGEHIFDIFYDKMKNDEFSKAEEESLRLIFDSLERDIPEVLETADKFNYDFLLDQTAMFFRQQSLKHLAEDLDTHIQNGDLEEAEGQLSQFHRIEKELPKGINPLESPEAYQKAFESREEPLFRLPGAYGELINPHLIRGGFLAFLARAKAGKTWRLIDIAMRAARERCKVAIFQLGDLSQDDYMVRQAVYLSKRSNDPIYCNEVLVPILDCLKNQQGACPYNKGKSNGKVVEFGDLSQWGKRDWLFEHQSCVYCCREKHFEGSLWWRVREKVSPLTWREAWKNTDIWKKRHKVRGLRLATYPNSSVDVDGIEQQLDLWDRVDNYRPDVVVLDYPDIMKPDKGVKEKRQQEDERWRSLRRLSQERHICLITVTQSNRSGFDDKDLSAFNTSEDKRKLDHVTVMFGLNQTEEEEEQGVIRIESILQREGKKRRSQVTVLQNLETGQPYIASYWIKKKPKKKK